MHLARNCAPGALHNVDLITDMVLQMAHRNTSSINTSAADSFHFDPIRGSVSRNNLFFECSYRRTLFIYFVFFMNLFVSRSPTIVTQWLELLVLLERSNIPLWAKVLNTGRGLTNSRLGHTLLNL